jgi:hypothetical protein
MYTPVGMDDKKLIIEIQKHNYISKLTIFIMILILKIKPGKIL